MQVTYIIVLKTNNYAEKLWKYIWKQLWKFTNSFTKVTGLPQNSDLQLLQFYIRQKSRHHVS